MNPLGATRLSETISTQPPPRTSGSTISIARAGITRLIACDWTPSERMNLTVTLANVCVTLLSVTFSR
jgi:hypothetical protein